MKPGGDSENSGAFSAGEEKRVACGRIDCETGTAAANSGDAGEYLTVCCSALRSPAGNRLQHALEVSTGLCPLPQR
jgi:hypothetical protein